jgi:peptide-methionine (R)-S-oxide reductase
MNILRLVIADKEKKGQSPNPEFQKIEAVAECKPKEKYPVCCDKAELRKKLSPMEYFVTQERGTERPFSGKYLHETGDGIFTCIVCANILFRSDQKFESGCGWPSFADVQDRGSVIFTKDASNGMSRIEVSCSHCGAHLGHVFDDGPQPNRLRYCINSASLGFSKPSSV